jgi:hypothetical protein
MAKSKESGIILSNIKDILEEVESERTKAPERRLTGIKVGMWIGIFYSLIRVYQKTPLRDEINRLFESEVI